MRERINKLEKKVVELEEKIKWLEYVVDTIVNDHDKFICGECLRVLNKNQRARNKYFTKTVCKDCLYRETLNHLNQLQVPDSLQEQLMRIVKKYLEKEST